MTTIDHQQIQKAERLTDAFRIFNQLSENLAISYQSLEEQVTRLTQELAAARSERVTTLIEKERLASRFQQILAALPAAVIILNATGQVIDCNNHAIDFLEEPLIGQEWQVVMSKSLLAVQGSPCERQLKDGRKISITRNLLSNGNDAEQIILLSDISELRSLQDLLAQQNHLSAMGEMVASLAHQVRTPLATALLYASQMSKPTLAEHKRLQFSQKILERLSYLERQINDMLIFAKQGRLAMQSFSLRTLLLKAGESMESFSGSYKSLIQLDNDMLIGNEDALYGAVMNLLNNAAESGADKINLNVLQGHEQSVRIEIEDNGPGIEADRLVKVFEPFYTTKSHGTGLGLAVVDSVVKAHNGSIICKSVKDRGTAFILTLPGINQYGLGLSTASFN